LARAGVLREARFADPAETELKELPIGHRPANCRTDAETNPKAGTRKLIGMNIVRNIKWLKRLVEQVSSQLNEALRLPSL
jgi:hypothetical protein